MTDNNSSLTDVEAQEVSRSIDALESIGAGQAARSGRLVLKGAVVVSINAERLVPVVLKCLLETFPAHSLDFMDVVSTSNGGLFPLDKLARGLGKALEPYAGRISSPHRHQLVLEGDEFINYKRENKRS